MPLSRIFRRFRKSARKAANHHGSSVAATEAEHGSPLMIAGYTNSAPSLAPEAPIEATTEVAPDPVEPFVAEVAPEPPQENGYRSLLPGDEIPDLQTVLASCGQLMISLSTGDGLLEGRNVIELEQSVIRAFQRIRILRNDARPIGKLPPDILIPIFDLIATPSKEVDSTSAFENLTSLIHVCRYWRSILFNHCRVWSNVHLKGQDPQLLSWQMAFSKGAPLDVTAHLHHRVSSYRSLHNFQASVKTIRDCRQRVRSLSVHIPRDDSFQDAFDFELPNLEELAWEEVDLGPPAPLVGNPIWNANRHPKLRSLSLKGTLDWPMAFTSGLTRFKFEGPMTLAVTDISDFLQANRTLESLGLVNLHIPPGTPQQIRRIELRGLTDLSLSNVEYGHVFTCMSLPALETLRIGTFDQPAWWSWTVWHNLSLPSGITSLNVKYLGWEDGLDRVCITGFDDARTHSLNFTEHSVGKRFNHLISALSPAATNTVTSISFDEEGTNDPRYQLPASSLGLLLSRLYNLTHMDLCWGHLTHKVVEHLEHKCPNLKVLRVKTTWLTCPVTFDLVLRMAQIRASERRRLDKIERVVPEDEDGPGKTGELWDTLARTADLDCYLSDRSW